MAARLVQNAYRNDLHSGLHNWLTGTYELVLVNAAHSPTARKIADVTPVTPGGGVSLTLTISAVNVVNTNESAVLIADLAVSPVGANVGVFQTAYVRNVTNDLFAFGYDYGPGQDVLDGETKNFVFDQVNGAATLENKP